MFDLKNNIEIKIRQLEVKRIEKSRNSVWNQLLPNISFNGSQSYNFGSTIDPSTNGRVSSNIQYDNFFINANMNLIDFNAFANAQKNKIDVEKAKALAQKSQEYASEAGKEWHASHAVKSWENRKWHPVKCQECSTEFFTPYPTRAKFCNQNCKAQALRRRRGKTVGVRPDRRKTPLLSGKRATG